MIEPVDANDDLTVDARCSFTGCPTMLRTAVAARTRFEVLMDAILDVALLGWRLVEWAALGLVLYGLFFYP